jgi:hypothetical protein
LSAPQPTRSLHPPELVHDRRSTSVVASERVLVSAWKSPFFSAFIRLRAVGEAALGAQNLVQAVAALAAEDARRQIQRHMIGVLPLDADVADADFRLHRVRLVTT